MATQAQTPDLDPTAYQLSVVDLAGLGYDAVPASGPTSNITGLNTNILAASGPTTPAVDKRLLTTAPRTRYRLLASEFHQTSQRQAALAR